MARLDNTMNKKELKKKKEKRIRIIIRKNNRKYVGDRNES